MKKVGIWLLAVTGVFLVLIIAATAIIPRFIKVESYLPQIEQRVSELTGRSFQLGDEFSLSIFPWTSIALTDLQLGSPDHFDTEEFIRIDSFEARVKLLPLLSGQIEVDKFILDGFEIHLVKQADGLENWRNTQQDDQPHNSPSEQEGPSPPTTGEQKRGFAISSLDVQEFSLTNGTLIYIDQSAEQRREVSNINLVLQDVSLQKPVKIDFRAVFADQPIGLSGAIGPLGDLSGQGPIAVNLLLTAVNELSVSLAGNLSALTTDPSFAFAVAVEPFSPRALLDQLAIELPITPADPQTLQHASAALNIEGSPTTLLLKDGTLTLDESTLDLTAAIQEFARPDLSFNLTLDSINIDRYLPAAGKKEGGGNDSTAVPAEQSADNQQSQGVAEASSAEVQPAAEQPIDYAPLRKLKLLGEISTGTVIAHGATLDNLVFKIEGADGVFTIDPLTIRLYQGDIKLLAHLDLTADKPTTKADLTINKIQVGPLLEDAIKNKQIEGGLAATATLRSTGDSAAEIKRSLTGTGTLRFTDGALVGLDLADMARSFASGLGYEKPDVKSKTDFAELNVPFTITNGVFNTPDSRLLSPLLRVTAQGSANLVAETLDMKIQPKVVSTLKGQGDTESRTEVTVPIMVTGTFSEPEFSANLTELMTGDNLQQVLDNPEAAKETLKSLEDSGKGLLKSFGF